MRVGGVKVIQWRGSTSKVEVDNREEIDRVRNDWHTHTHTRAHTHREKLDAQIDKL